MLYGWDDRKFEDEYLKKLKRNGSQFLWRRNLEGGIMSESQTIDFIFYFLFYFIS